MTKDVACFVEDVETEIDSEGEEGVLVIVIACMSAAVVIAAMAVVASMIIVSSMIIIITAMVAISSIIIIVAAIVVISAVIIISIIIVIIAVMIIFVITTMVAVIIIISAASSMSRIARLGHSLCRGVFRKCNSIRRGRGLLRLLRPGISEGIGRGSRQADLIRYKTIWIAEIKRDAPPGREAGCSDVSIDGGPGWDIDGQPGNTGGF